MPLNAQSPSVNLEVKAETLRDYVRGFPVYAAITIAAPQDTSLSGLRFPNLVSLSGSVGIEIKSLDGRIVSEHMPAPRPSENPRRAGGTLEEGEVRRMLTDISSLLPPSLSEGEYSARVVYATRPGEFHWSKPFKLMLRNPTNIEAGWLSSQAPDRDKALQWTDWTYTQPKYPVYMAEISRENPLKLNLLLRRLFFGPESLEQVNPEILDVLVAGNESKLYEPETWALKAELYHARGDQQEYRECVQLITRRTNGLAWWIRMMESGGGFLKTFRMGPRNR